MEIKELHTLTSSQVDEILALMNELDPTISVSAETLLAAVKEPSTHFFAAVENEHILGCASLCITRHPLGLKGGIEDVVVSSSCRGQGLGRKLMEHIISYAKSLAPIELHLTSRPFRESANHLYLAVGFQPYDTNVYKYPII